MRKTPKPGIQFNYFFAYFLIVLLMIIIWFSFVCHFYFKKVIRHVYSDWKDFFLVFLDFQFLWYFIFYYHKKCDVLKDNEIVGGGGLQPPPPSDMGSMNYLSQIQIFASKVYVNFKICIYTHKWQVFSNSSHFVFLIMTSAFLL